MIKERFCCDVVFPASFHFEWQCKFCHGTISFVTIWR